MADGKGYILGERAAKAVEALVRTNGGPGAAQPAEGQSAPTLLVQVTGAAGGDGWYPAKVMLPDATGLPITTGDACWVQEANDAALANGNTYLCQRTGVDGNGLAYFVTESSGGGSVPDATHSVSGKVNTGTQTFGGLKTFDGLIVDTRYTGYVKIYNPTVSGSYGQIDYADSGGTASLYLRSARNVTWGVARLDWDESNITFWLVGDTAAYAVSRGGVQKRGVDFSYTLKGDGPDAGFQIALTCTGGIITSKARNQVAAQVVAS